MQESYTIANDDVTLDADVVVPAQARGVVLFAHGSGSSRHSPRNRFVAAELQSAGHGTVLADLLTREEETLDARTGSLRFDIELLTNRVIVLIDWIWGHEPTAGLGVGLFGASTGAAAALAAAALRPEVVKAIVSRGGRPDLAGDSLGSVHQPTLLIVGGRDEQVIGLNEQAAATLRVEHAVQIVPGATHLFEEPGTLEQVAGWAAEWFDHHLTGGDLTLDGYLPDGGDSNG